MPTCICNLGYLLQCGTCKLSANPVRAVELYERAMELGNIDSMVNLGNILMEGANGVPQNPVRAVELLERGIDD